MTNDITQQFPRKYRDIDLATRKAGFTMASDPLTCNLLRTLAASKQGGRFLELGTGTGLSTCWILDGMDADSTLISIDNDLQSLEIARNYLGEDSRLNLFHGDAGTWLEENKHLKFDFIFADTWHGKFLLLDHALHLLSKGGLYIIDDMLPQPNWPEGHQEKVSALIDALEANEKLLLSKLVWSTGIVLAVKK